MAAVASKKTRQNVVLEDVRIGFRNFSGKEGKFTAEGERQFLVFLDAEVASKMLEDGWNIRELKSNDDYEEPQAYLPVKVSYNPKARPPKVVMITSRGKTQLGEGEIATLDWAWITHVDLILNPYHYDVNGKQGIKAYLHSIYVTIEENQLEEKYGDVIDSASNSVQPSDDGDVPF